MTHVEFMREFGNNLAYQLTEYGISQRELSDELGISKSTINAYIKGVRMPSAKTINNLAVALRCDINDLVGFYEIVC